VADLRRLSLRVAIALAVAVLGLVDIQGLVQTLRSQARLRGRMIQSVRDGVFTARPRLGQILRPGGPAAWSEAAREAVGSSLAAEVEIFDASGRRLFTQPAPAPVQHWLSPTDMQVVRSGKVVTLGPIAGESPRLLTYAIFQSADESVVLRLATPVPELVEDMQTRREILIGHAISLVILLAAAALALFPRAESPASPARALDAYEEAMEQLQERGRTMSREHEAERRRMEERIQDREALARAGELTAGIAHEVRNGLATIVGYARLVEKDATPESREAAQKIRQECATLETVVRRFMDFVKREELTLAPVELGRMLSRVVARESGSRPGPEISCPPWLGLGTVMGDEEMLERAFENIVRNAREAAGQDGHVAIAVARDDAVVAVSIIDDGPGLPAGTGRDVRPFRSTKPGGLGLGLPLALKIVHLHRGDLVLGDRLPHGLAVTVRLPVAGPAA